jgi:hypothetical protein
MTVSGQFHSQSILTPRNVPLPTECRISELQLKNNNDIRKMDFVTWRKVALGVDVWSEALILLGH